MAPKKETAATGTGTSSKTATPEQAKADEAVAKAETDERAKADEAGGEAAAADQAKANKAAAASAAKKLAASDDGKLKIELAKALELTVGERDIERGRLIPAQMILSVTEHDTGYGVVTVDGRKLQVEK